MKALLETDESPAAVLYRSCMAPIKPQDADTVLGPWLDIVDTVVDNSTFVEAVIAINNADLSFLWTWYVDTDAWNKQRHAFTISQSHTSLDADLVAAINEDPTDTDAVADLDAQVGRRPKTYVRAHAAFRRAPPPPPPPSLLPAAPPSTALRRCSATGYAALCRTPPAVRSSHRDAILRASFGIVQLALRLTVCRVMGGRTSVR